MEELDRHRPDREQLVALVAAAVAGDRGAREALARHCRPRVRRTVYLALGPGPDVEDLTQTTLTQVFRKLDGYRGEASFWVWVDRIATNEVRMHFRRRGWRLFQRYEEDREDHQPAGPAPDELAAQQRSVRRLARHLATLRPTLRLPLVLSMVHGYRIEEIAAILELSYEAAKKRLLRGRRALLQRLRDDPSFEHLGPEDGR